MRAVVTGGGGFLGRRIVELLRERGDDVRTMGRHRYPALEALGARCIPADVRDTAAVRRALEGAAVVFHAAARTDLWGRPEDLWAVNVTGTESVLAASRSAGIGLLVYTSTPSVVGYAEDVENGGPDLPYATVHESPYAATKAAAERLVLSANGPDLATVALRPHLVIGPGDFRMLPRVVARAARGRLLMIGDGRNRVDLTDVDNAAWAHLDAADALSAPGARCAGRAYFISNGEPVLLWAWLAGVLSELGLPPVTRSLPLSTARRLGSALETTWRACRLPGEPPVTRFLAAALARSHWYDLTPARRDLGYRVRVPMEHATRRAVRWLAESGYGTGLDRLPVARAPGPKVEEHAAP
jgi:2-alkyl-3-oxoalkanoate reductase